MLHCRSKLGWLLGLAALLLVQLADGRWHNVHRTRHSLETVKNEDEDGQPASSNLQHPGFDEDKDDWDDGMVGDDEYQDSVTDEDDSLEYEEIQRVPPHHRLVGHKLHRHQQQRQHRVLPTASLGQFIDPEDPMKLAREHPTRDTVQRHRPRGKRVSQRRHWTEKDRESFGHRPLALDNERREYELEVREAQNSSLCNYTVVPIPDPGGRIPRELEHVKCNHVGSKCQDKGTYCCIQTYRNVEVIYEDGKIELMKVYSGCVCSLQIYGTLEPYTPNLEIND